LRPAPCETKEAVPTPTMFVMAVTAKMIDIEILNPATASVPIRLMKCRLMSWYEIYTSMCVPTGAAIFRMCNVTEFSVRSFTWRIERG
jgi:hypothetical protein